MMLKVFYDGQHNFPFSTNTCKLFNGLDIAAQESVLILFNILEDRYLWIYDSDRDNFESSSQALLDQDVKSRLASSAYYILEKLIT